MPSLIICVMDHCFPARTDLCGGASLGLHPFVAAATSGPADEVDGVSPRRWISKLMIIICLRELLEAWHLFYKHDGLLNTKGKFLVWILFDWSGFPKEE